MRIQPQKRVNLLSETPWYVLLWSSFRTLIDCRLYQIKPKLMHLGRRVKIIPTHMLWYVVAKCSYTMRVITPKIYLPHNVSVEPSPVYFVNNSISFHPCSRLVVFENVRLSLWERNLINLLEFVLWRASKAFYKTGIA